MKFFVGGKWQDRDDRMNVINPSNGEVIDTVPCASPNDIELALATAKRASRVMAEMSGYDRFRILRRAADMMIQRQQPLAETLSREEGKTIAESSLEVVRAAQTMELSGEEAKRLGGEVLPLDGAQGTCLLYTSPSPRDA